MLVALVLAVAGEMLDGRGQAQLLDPLYIRFAHAPHARGVTAEGACVGDRVTEVRVDVDDGGECPVGAHGRRLAGTGFSHVGGYLYVVRGGDLHGRAHQRALRHNTVASLFQVCRDQKGHFAAHAQCLGGRHGAGCGHHAVHAAAGRQNAVHIVELLGFGLFEQHAEQLPGLFLGGHARQGVFHPGNGIVVQIKWICLQIDHRFSLISSFWGVSFLGFVHEEIRQRVRGQALCACPFPRFTPARYTQHQRGHRRAAAQQGHQRHQSCTNTHNFASRRVRLRRGPCHPL